MTTRSNDNQIRFWNHGPGSNWVTYQRGLDQCFENINRRLLELCVIRPGHCILDIGCGAGATSIALAKKYGNTVSITGVDVSKPLLKHASRRIRSIKPMPASIRLIEADVQNKPLEPAVYHQLVSRFGVMFFADPCAAFRNLKSSLRPDGSMVFVAWSTVENNPWFQIPKSAAISRLGNAAPVDPREPGPMAFADLDYLDGILRHSGFRNYSVEEEDNVIATRLPVDQMADLACNLGPAIRLMKEKNGTVQDHETIKEEVANRFMEYETGGGLEVPVRLVVCRA
ncbi:MAG: methyltransferase domain-containing protein [Gammaproteobacteria bacterium]|nr:methyltransferase domain-containing protein [Gammaproteobacteria bacterium]